MRQTGHTSLFKSTTAYGTLICQEEQICYLNNTEAAVDLHDDKHTNNNDLQYSYICIGSKNLLAKINKKNCGDIVTHCMGHVTKYATV